MNEKRETSGTLDEETELQPTDFAVAVEEVVEDESDDMVPTRNIRQRDLVDEKKLSEYIAVVVGAGAVGHQICRQIAALGFLEAVVCDCDTVQIENMSAQGFCPEDIDSPKAHVVGEEMANMFPEMQIRTLHERFSAKVMSMIPNDKKIVVLCCVDTMSSRKEVFEAFQDKAAAFIDSRMGAETGRVIFVDDVNMHEYPPTLFSDADAFIGPCTAKSTHYCANVISGLAVSRFVKKLRGRTVDLQVVFDLMMGDMFVEK